MTRLDAAALHAHLTTEIRDARRRHLDLIRHQHDHRLQDELADRADQVATALVMADGWLRTQAFDSGHQPGETIHIATLMARLTLHLDEWLEYLDGRAELADHEGRPHAAATYHRLATGAHYFAVVPDPFAEPVVFRPRRWSVLAGLRRLVGAA